MSKRTLVALWSSVGVFALGCVLFVVWYSHSAHQAKVSAANGRISLALAAASEWLAIKNPSVDGATVEQQLTEALNDLDATDKNNGAAVVNQVRQRRQELAEQVRIERAQRRATAIFDDAKRRIDRKELTETTALLRQYIADPHASEKADVQRLLDEMEIAVSDALIVDALVAMNDAEFNQVQAGGKIHDGKLSHPVLIEIRNQTVQRNLDRAAQRREVHRIAEQNRREAERLAMLERRRQEEERGRQEEAERQLREARQPLKVFLGGELRDELAAHYRLLPKPKWEEVRKNASASAFDKAETKWESKYLVENIVLATGATMDISVENHNNKYGQYSKWWWTITLAVPDGMSSYKAMSFEHAIGDDVKKWTFVLGALGEDKDVSLALYAFPEFWNPIPQIKEYRPIDSVLRRMVSAETVKYRLSTGPPVVGPKAEGQLSPEAIQLIKELLGRAKYKNEVDR